MQTTTFWKSIKFRVNKQILPCVNNCLLRLGRLYLICWASIIVVSNFDFPESKILKLLQEKFCLHVCHTFKFFREHGNSSSATIERIWNCFRGRGGGGGLCSVSCLLWGRLCRLVPRLTQHPSTPPNIKQFYVNVILTYMCLLWQTICEQSIQTN